jgi:UDP-N-acetylmuramate--alanine ligase
MEDLGAVTLKIPGHHNVLNATGALAVIHQLGLPMKKAIAAVSSFTGAGRRFEVFDTDENITIIDDYGHHPTEIAATLEAARSRYPDRRLWAVWQPHTYSRTQSLEQAFIRALRIADRVIVLKIYAAREEDPGYSSERIAKALPDGKAEFIAEFTPAVDFLLKNLDSGDVLIVFSAGDATHVSQSVLSGLHQSNKHQKEI